MMVSPIWVTDVTSVIQCKWTCGVALALAVWPSGTSDATMAWPSVTGTESQVIRITLILRLWHTLSYHWQAAWQSANWVKPEVCWMIANSVHCKLEASKSACQLCHLSQQVQVKDCRALGKSQLTWNHCKASRTKSQLSATVRQEPVARTLCSDTSSSSSEKCI